MRKTDIDFLAGTRNGTGMGQGVMVLKLRLKEGRFDIRKMFFAMRIIKHWTRLFREVIDVSCLEIFDGS